MTSSEKQQSTSSELAEVELRITKVRDRMDELDARLVALLNERASCAQEIGRLKDTVGLKVYQPRREREVLEHVRAENTGPLDGDAITRLFERIIDEARSLERSSGRGSAP